MAVDRWLAEILKTSYWVCVKLSISCNYFTTMVYKGNVG